VSVPPLPDDSTNNDSAAAWLVLLQLPSGCLWGKHDGANECALQESCLIADLRLCDRVIDRGRPHIELCSSVRTPPPQDQTMTEEDMMNIGDKIC
jgi:hypothetical protein